MQIGTWWLYALTVFIVAGTPGPNMLHIMMRSIQVGARRSVFAMAGCLTAVLLCLFASAFGLGALLKAEPRLFDVLRYGGVAYLLWLGVKAWRSPITTPDDADAVRPVQSAGSLYRGGLLIGLSNAVPSCAIVLRMDCRVRGVGVRPDWPPLIWEAWTGSGWAP